MTELRRVVVEVERDGHRYVFDSGEMRDMKEQSVALRDFMFKALGLPDPKKDKTCRF